MANFDDERNGFEDNANENNHDKNYDRLCLVLSTIQANLNQLAEHSCSIQDQINRLEIDCLDLLQPMGDTIALERELQRLNKIVSNYTASKEKK